MFSRQFTTHVQTHRHNASSPPSRRLRGAALTFALAALLSPAAHAQSTTPATQALKPLSVPINLRSQLAAQGDRFSRPGKERVLLTGNLTGTGGPGQLSITRDTQGRFHLERQGQKTIAFDGQQSRASSGGLSQEDEDLIESLATDSVEGFFSAVDQGGALRLLGRRFRTDDGSSANYAGPYFDIYELVRPLKEHPSAPLRQKFYFFDSQTGELRRVRYEVNRGGLVQIVETEISGWTAVAGELFPARVERVVDGRSTFVFQAASVQIASDANDSKFDRP